MIFGILYVSIEYTSGRKAAQRTLRYFVFYMLLCGVVFASLYQLFGTKYLLFSLVIPYSIGIGFRLFSWRFRKQKAGGLLLDLGNTDQNKNYITIGFLYGTISVLTSLMLAFRAFTSFSEGLSLVIYSWTTSILNLALSLGKLEFRENGICLLFSFVAWQRVESYRWSQSASNNLTIILSPQFPFVPVFIAMTIPAQHLDAVSDILNQRSPDQNL